MPWLRNIFLRAFVLGTLSLLWCFPSFGGQADGPQSLASTDWPWWRGPNRNGIAAADQKPPLTWSDTQNVVWRSLIPGKGHGSPIVVGDQVYLQTAEPDREVQSVVCLDRKTGVRLWQTDVHRGGFDTKGNEKTSLANSTPASNGLHLFVNFLNAGAVQTTALDRHGKQIWQKKISDFAIHQGFGSSPAISDSLVIVAADNHGTGAIAALDQATGDVVWKHSRPKIANYTSPMILEIQGQRQVVLSGCKLVTSYEPLTGKLLWEIPGSTEECVTSTVTDGQQIYITGGYPKNHVAAVKADGSGQVVWENGSRVYVPSLLLFQGFLYATLDSGVAVCWRCDTGEERWKNRLSGTFSSSPVLVGDCIIATNEDGKSFVFKANPEAFELIAENQLGSHSYATPSICGGCIYHRVAVQADGQRQEYLYCLGQKSE